MRIESSYPTPIHGVSTLTPRNRARGQAGVQKNFRSDPVKKLTRRPALNFVSRLLQNIEPYKVFHHSYIRKGSTYRIIVNKTTGEVFGFKDNVPQTVVGDLSNYVGSNMVAQSIEHTTYVVNQDTTVEMTSDVDSTEFVSHINITAALNYGETVQVNVTKSNGDRHVVTYTVPDLGTSNPDYDTADKARQTKQVAAELAARINGGGTYETRIPNPQYPDDPYNNSTFQKYCQPYRSDGSGGCEPNPYYNPDTTICKAYLTDFTGISGVTAVALGSTVAVWEDGRADWLDLELETGQGDRTSRAFNQVIENTTGIPLYAVVGTRITVKPDPTSDKGTYYLQAERTADTPSGEPLEEVVWSESRNADQPHALDETTMPHSIEWDEDNNQFVVGSVNFRDRLKGDDDSVPIPEFVGREITNLGYFQKRLVFLTDNFVVMSEADDEYNFWKQSAVNLLVSDRIEISSSAVGIDELVHIVPHNRDLLVIASNGQFKIDGSTGITPETISMPLTTKYQCQVDVAPVVMGNSVFFTIDYGDSTGLQEYTGEKDTSQDFAAALTHHVIGYMEGAPTLLAASPNLEMIAVKTQDAADNQLFIYEQFTSTSGKREQQSWSEWTFTMNGEIVDIEFDNDRLVILTVENNTLYIKELRMYARVSVGTQTVFLDDMVRLSTNGKTVTLPDGYVPDDIICVRGENTKNEYFKVAFTRNDQLLTFDEDIGAGFVYVGKLFESRYQPTRPFRYGDDGIAITTDRIRVGKFILNLVDSNEVKMHIISPYYDTEDQVFNSRFVGQTQLGVMPFYTGDHKFSFSQDAEYAVAEFYTDNWLGCTVAGLSWEGQYFQSKGRM